MFTANIFEGKVALITGVGQPFADALVHRFSALGARLALVYDRRDAEKALAVEAPEGTIRMECNGVDAKQVRTVVRGIAAELGRIDVLICASYAEATEPLREIALDRWQEAVDAQLCTTLHFNREVIRPMMRNKSGRIINVIYALAGPAANVAARGVAAMTRTLAAELAPQGIYVNCIGVGELEEQGANHDGVRVTRQTSSIIRSAAPLGRLGRVDEVAEVAVFLASDAARLTSGHTIPASGGIYP
ncbi:MAG: SDR family NAD(P)-dependent oxidoreductase [Thermoanaerobaculia bacterium]